MGRQVVAALRHMHERARLVHRDVKPANFLLSSDARTLKICDFGIAEPIADAASGCIAPQYCWRWQSALLCIMPCTLRWNNCRPMPYTHVSPCCAL